MTHVAQSGTFTLGDRKVRRLGYGAMRLSGPGIFGPPRDRAAAIAVLREAVAAGVNHIDTCDYYGPHLTNQIIREALSPYPDDLVLTTKVGARRDDTGAWLSALAPDDLKRAVHDNLRNLGLDALDVVNLRVGGFDTPEPGSLAASFTALAGLQQEGLIHHLGISNVNAEQIAEAQSIAPIACVQNHYNLAHRDDDALIAQLAGQGIAYVPFFPLGGFSPLQSTTLDAVASRLGASPMQVALAWLLQRSRNLLLIPGTSSIAHLRENLASAALTLPADALALLDGMARAHP